MSIEKLSKAIDYRVKQLVTAIEYKGYSRAGIDMVAEAIDTYRAEVAKEIKGLKGDVKSAEAAYEREGLRLNEIQRQRDQWKNDHDRVAKEKHQLQKAYDSNVTELKALALHAGDLEQDRDDWKADAAASETKLEKAIEERDAWRKAYLSSEPASPEGDKTVITFECCNVTHFFGPPKFGNWNHQAECQECGSLTTFTSAN